MQEKNIDGAYSLYDQGDYQSALDYALDMIANNIQLPEAHIVVAESYLELGDFDNTIIHYNKTLEIDPDNYQAMVGLGEVYFGSGKIVEAKDVFLRAMEKNPDAVELYNYAAHVYRDMGELDNAVEVLEKAITIDPSYAEAYLNLGTSYIMMSEYIKAVEVLQKSIELDSMSYTAYNNLSLAYYRMGEYEKALEAIENAIKLSPGDPKVLKNLTYLAEEIEKIKPEYVEFETGAKEAPVEDLELVRNNESGIAWSLSEQDYAQTEKKIYWEDSDQEAIGEKPGALLAKPAESVAVADVGTEQMPIEEVAEIVDANESSVESTSDTTDVQMTAAEVPAVEVPAATNTINEIDTTIVNDDFPVEGPGNISIEKIEEPELKNEKPEKEKTEEKAQKAPDKASEITAVKPAVKDDRFVPYNPPEINMLPMVEKIELPQFEGGLEPLPLPENGLSSGLETFDGEMLSFGGFSLSELAEMRKTLPGIFYFVDRENMLWRYQPDSNAMQKMFKGISPSCSRDGGRILYVTWDLHSVRLYLYDFASSSRSIILTSEQFIKAPSFSPDGNYVAFITVTSAFKNILEVISLSDLSRSVFSENVDVKSYDWSPDLNTVVMVDEKCTGTNSIKRSDVCMYEWNVETKAVETTSLNFDVKADQQRYSMVWKKKIRFLPDGKKILIYPVIDGYREFYIADLNDNSFSNKYFSGIDGEKLRIWNLSPGYEVGSYTWSSRGSVWSSSENDSLPFPAIVGHYVNSDVAWCREPAF